MSTALASSQPSQALRAVDADLPFLASEAAIDLDNLRSGVSGELGAVRRLAERLKNSMPSSANQENARALDPATLVVLGEAVTVLWPTDHSQRKVDELLAKAAEIADFLSGELLTEDSGKLDSARSFCVALSRAALTYRKSLRDLRPSHPFRR